MASNILPSNPYPPYRSGSESSRTRRRGTRWSLSPAFSGPDMWVAVRPQLTDELRAACAVLVVMEERQQLPALPERMLQALTPVVGELGNGSRRRARTLLKQLVQLRILRRFGRRNEKFNAPAPGVLARLLKEPSRRESVIGPVIQRGK